jgi:hypothetical protein
MDAAVTSLTIFLEKITRSIKPHTYTFFFRIMHHTIGFIVTIQCTYAHTLVWHAKFRQHHQISSQHA